MLHLGSELISDSSRWSVQRHAEVLKQRQSLIHELGEKHSIPGYAGHRLSDEEIAEFEQKMDEAINRQTTKIERIKVRSCLPAWVAEADS